MKILYGFWELVNIRNFYNWQVSEKPTIKFGKYEKSNFISNYLQNNHNLYIYFTLSKTNLINTF